MPSELAALERASGLPLASFRREHVNEQVERACRREQVAAADGARRAGCGTRRRGAPPLPPLGRDLARGDVPRPGAVRAARGRAAAAAAGGWRAAERVVGGLLGRLRAALARARARAPGRARPRAAARQRPAGGEPRAGARAATTPSARARADALGASATWRRTARRPGAGGSCCAATSRSTSSRRRARPAVRRRSCRALSARAACCCSGRSERLIDPARFGLRPVAPARLRAGGMRRRLTLRTLGRLGADRGRRRGVIGLLAIAIDRQHDAGERARQLAGRDRRREPHPAAAAGRPDEHPRLPDPRQRGRADGLPRGARGATRRGARARRPASPSDPGAARGCAEEIRAEALSLRQQLRRAGDRAHARGRASARGGRSRAPHEGAHARERAAALIDRLGDAPSRPLSSRARARRRRRLGPRAADRAGSGSRCACSRWRWRRRSSRAGSCMPVGRLAAAAERVRRGELDVDGPRAPRRRDRPAGRRVQRDGARARAEPRTSSRARTPSSRCRRSSSRSARSELTEAGDEARAQRDELERTAAQLADEKRRAELHGDVRRPAGRRARRARRWPGSRYETLADAAGADVGVLYGGELARRRALDARRGHSGSSRRMLAEHAWPGERAPPRGRSRRATSSCWSRSPSARADGSGGEARGALGAARAAAIRRARARRGHAGRRRPTAFDRTSGRRLQRLAGQAAVGAGRGRRLARAQLALAGQRGGARRRARGDRAGRARPRARVRQRGDGAARGAAVDADRRGDRGAGRPDRRVDCEAYFADWEAMLADADEPTADELAVGGVRAGALHGAGRRRARRADRPPGGAARRHPRARGRPAEVRPDGDRLARAAHAAGVASLGYAELLRTRRLDAATRDGDPRHRPPRGQAPVGADRRLPGPAVDRAGPAVAGARAVLGRRRCWRSQVRDVRRAERVAPARARRSRGAGRWHSATARGSPRWSRTCSRTRSSTRRTAASSRSPRPAPTVLVRVRSPTRASASPPAEQAHIFEKFFRVARGRPRASAAPASGSRWRTRSSSRTAGTMGFESAEGDGSTFWFTLPVAS